MSTLSNRTEPNSESDLDLDFFHPEEAVGWNADLGLDRYVQNQNLGNRIILLAKQQVPLSSVVFKYNIDFEQRHSPAGWTHSACCPFPDHNDRTPSFSFNSKENIFNCFGCGSRGGSVEFVSRMSGRQPLDVAKEFLRHMNQDEMSLIETIDDGETTRSDELLLTFSKEVHGFNKLHRNNTKAQKYVDKLTWVVDCYLEKHALDGSIDNDELEHITSRLIEYLSIFER